MANLEKLTKDKISFKTRVYAAFDYTTDCLNRADDDLIDGFLIQLSAPFIFGYRMFSPKSSYVKR